MTSRPQPPEGPNLVGTPDQERGVQVAIAIPAGTDTETVLQRMSRQNDVLVG